jgi:hypothetical protein
MSLSVGNLFEMKYMSSDTAQQEKKIQLMNIGASISYNLAADSLRLSPLSLSYRTDIGNILNISASTTHDFYVFEPAAGARVNKFVWSKKQFLPDLTSISFTLSTSLSGQKKESTPGGSVPDSTRQEQVQASGQIGQPAQMRPTQVFSKRKLRISAYLGTSPSATASRKASPIRVRRSAAPHSTPASRSASPTNGASPAAAAMISSGRSSLLRALASTVTFTVGR